MWHRALVIAVGLCCMNLAVAGMITTGDLAKKAAAFERILDHRSGEGDALDADAFMFYVQGVVDVGLSAKLMCVDHAISGEQLMGIVSKYLRANPEIWDEPAHVSVLTAVQIVFPCAKR